MSGEATATPATPAAPTDTTQEYAAFKLEQRGIDLVPDAERKMKPSGLFWLWAGAVFNVEFLFYGTLIMSFGLSVGQAIAAILIGNVFYVFLGWASLQGPKTGTTALMVSRAPFGRNGNRLVALFNWVTQVGFEIEGIYFVVATVVLLFQLHGSHLAAGAKIAVIVVAALIQMILPLLGHATISKVLRYLAYIFIAFFVLLAVFTFQRVHLSAFHAKPASFAVWTTALVVIISTGGLGWTENGNDYSRYLPRNTPTAKTFWAATLGGAIPSITLEILGVFAYTVTKKQVGITQLGIPQSFASWFVTPFLIFAIIQLLSINTIDMYSSGVTLQALGIPIKRWGTVILDTVVCAVITGFVLFHNSFRSDFTGFLLYIVVWLAPWFGIMMTDYLLRRRRYDAASLAAGRGGLYWRHGGIHWPGVIAQVVGMVAALMWINAAFDFPAYTGPISNHFPGLAGGDFSWALGIVVGALLYWLLAARSVPKEAAAQPADLRADAGGQQMGSETEQFRHPLDGPGHRHHDRTFRRVRHPLVDVAADERGSLHAHQVIDSQPGFGHFIAQLSRPVAERGEPPVLQGRQHPRAVDLVGDLKRGRVPQVEPFPEHPVDSDGPP
jgi:nucleobase:cation symporter-1, NCS1 family